MKWAAVLLVLVPVAQGQWGPSQGQWGKSDEGDLRVATWNVRDSLCRTANKGDGAWNWAAVARTVAALRPDVLVLQECGDNSGNGTGSGVDSVSNMTTVVDLFLHGGTDPFNGGTVGAYVQKWAPSFDMPYVYVPTISDGYNRNIILSVFPFGDLNGDGRSTLNDLPAVSSSTWAAGGDGGVRGVQFVEILLPNEVYVGDLVVGNAHFKAGGGSVNHGQRVDAASNAAYYIDHLYNGGGLGTPDPFGAISDSPPATAILSESTPVVMGGDWNEDEWTNGTKGPAEWLKAAVTLGGTDGTDRDRSDMTLDSATHYFTGSNDTIGSQKYDYIMWQDSIVSMRRAVVFDSVGTPVGSLPAEFAGYPSPSSLSSVASDHQLVFTDLILPVVDHCDEIYAYCVDNANSTGFPATLYWAGTPSVTGGGFTLLAQSAVPSQFGLFYYGPIQTQAPFGHGFRCVGSGLLGTFRLYPAIQSDAFGDAQRVLDWGSAPVGIGAGEIRAGETWNFQYWYRDPAAGSPGFNLTAALAVRFCV